MFGKPVKILCVDYDPYILETLQRFFRKDGFEVLTAGSAEEGMEIFRRCTPIQIVIADFSMSGMNGIDFLRLVKRDSPETVTILISGHAVPAAVSSAFDGRLVFRYLPKPWARAELRKTIAEALDLLGPCQNQEV